ncbi:MAG: preprotein translocase subunit SecG [Zoogloeaceae bacterium]|jgi:preprotein translocase subunit SecG|nr:preprotein translocase subunit SecG [Zoogloeaceae bacterium]
MNWWFSLALAVHIMVALGIIGLVLMQHGKGADMGAAFGSGVSGSLFGASGSANFLSRSTAALATIFFITSLALGYAASHGPKSAGSVMEGVVPSAPSSGPKAEVKKEAEIGKAAEETPAVPAKAPDSGKEIPR